VERKIRAFVPPDVRAGALIAKTRDRIRPARADKSREVALSRELHRCLLRDDSPMCGILRPVPPKAAGWLSGPGHVDSVRKAKL
jgi:hypothetical protein